MAKWEYSVVDKWGVPFTSEELNKFGSEGWELVTVIDAYYTLKGEAREAERYYVFKRERAN